jgi:hypothetical protein
MTRESRLLLTVVVMSGLGVAGLMLVANQYRRALTTTVRGKAGGEEASIRAIRLVDGYLAARTAAKAVIERYPVKIKQLTAVVTGDFSEVAGQRMSSNADTSSAYRIDRWNAFTAHGMTYEDYAAVRAAWRLYRSGGTVDDPALAAVFKARRGQLESADLGQVEALDDAIK